MRIPVVAVAALALLVVALRGRAAPPEEAEKLLEEARALDARAEKMLDQGNRPGAFEALARAADLRERARKIRAGEDPGPREAAAPRPGDARGAAREALARMEEALGKGDLKSAAAEGRQAFEALDRWAARLEAAPGRDVARRLQGLEAQVRDLRRMLDERGR